MGTIISHIKINGEGKTKEEMKKEFLEAATKEINDKAEEIFGEKKEEEPKEAKVKLNVYEKGEGFCVESSVEGDSKKVYNMLIRGIAALLATTKEDDPIFLLNTITDIVDAYIKFKKEGGEEENGEEE